MEIAGIAAGPVEIELKLEFDRADRARLLALLAAPAAGTKRHLVSTYFDTPGRDIAHAGYTLRVRRDGRRNVQAVKSLASGAGLFARPEWEHSLRGDRPLFDQRSGPLIAMIGSHALESVAPEFVTDIRRSRFRIDSDEAAIEVAIDEGEVRGSGRTERLCEIELELSRGMPSALFELARALNERVPLRLAVRSKAERGYALADPAPLAVRAESIGLDPASNAADGFRVIAQACIRQFRLNEARLLDTGEAEALHQARVGLRRLRSAFSIFHRLISGDARAGLLSAELHWLAAELGEVRNIDVLIPRFRDDTRDRLVGARDRAFRHVRPELAGARTRLLMVDLAEWLPLGAWRTRAARPERLEQNVRDFASDVLEARWERLSRRGAGLAGLNRKDRHKVRIEAKKLRYAAEFFASLYSGDKARGRHDKFLKALEALQRQLGELNDLAVGREVLDRLGIDATLPGSGTRRRHLLEQAGHSYHALMHAKRFW